MGGFLSPTIQKYEPPSSKNFWIRHWRGTGAYSGGDLDVKTPQFSSICLGFIEKKILKNPPKFQKKFKISFLMDVICEFFHTQHTKFPQNVIRIHSIFTTNKPNIKNTPQTVTHFLYDHFIFITMLTFIDVDTFKKFRTWQKFIKLCKFAQKLFQNKNFWHTIADACNNIYKMIE